MTKFSSDSLESLMLELTQLFQWPIVALVLIAFGYALTKTGGFFAEAVFRILRPGGVHALPSESSVSIESLETIVLRELEGLRLCSRITPMLGLVATMIPLGPALVAASSSNPNASAGNLGAAFATVIIALIAASLSFFVHTIRRRWLLEELNHLISERPL